MKSLFLGTSFSGHVDYGTGQVNPEYRRQIEAMIEALRKTGGFAVFCAVENEGWIMAGGVPPEVGVEKDLAVIDESDVMLAVLPTGLISGGLQYEIGYAEAKGKKVVLASEVGAKLAYFNQGAVNLGRVTYLEFDSPESLAAQVNAAVR